MQRRLPTTVLLLALCSIALAGCVDEKAPAPDEPATPTVNDGNGECTDCGTIRGVVGSDLFEALGGAHVTLILPDGDREVQTDARGNYGFENVPAGRWDLFAFAAGYHAGREAAVVDPAQTAEVKFALTPLPSDEPFQDVLDWTGKITYAAAWQAEPAGQECVVVPSRVWTVKTCGGLRDSDSINGEVDFNITADVETILIEMAWTPAGPLGEYLSLDVMCPEVPRGAGGSVLDTEHPCYYGSENTQSPIRYRIDADAWRDGQYNHTGEWAARVFSTYGMAGTYDTTGIDVGVAYEQTFTIYATIFHKEPAPEGFSGLPGA